MIEEKLDTCVELGLLYRINPLDLYDRPDSLILDLWNRTMKVIAASRENDDG